MLPFVCYFSADPGVRWARLHPRPVGERLDLYLISPLSDFHTDTQTHKLACTHTTTSNSATSILGVHVQEFFWNLRAHTHSVVLSTAKPLSEVVVTMSPTASIQRLKLLPLETSHFPSPSLYCKQIVFSRFSLCNSFFKKKKIFFRSYILKVTLSSPETHSLSLTELQTVTFILKQSVRC